MRSNETFEDYYLDSLKKKNEEKNTNTDDHGIKEVNLFDVSGNILHPENGIDLTLYNEDEAGNKTDNVVINLSPDEARILGDILRNWYEPSPILNLKNWVRGGFSNNMYYSTDEYMFKIIPYGDCYDIYVTTNIHGLGPFYSVRLIYRGSMDGCLLAADRFLKSKRNGK